MRMLVYNSVDDSVDKYFKIEKARYYNALNIYVVVSFHILVTSIVVVLVLTILDVFQQRGREFRSMIGV